MIDSSAHQKAYKKRQHMSFDATLQFHGTQKIFNAITRHGKAERSRIDSDREQRKTSPFSRRQSFFKNGKIWRNNQTTEATSTREPSRHHTSAGRSNNTSPRTRRYSNNQTAETSEATSRHHTTADRNPSASRREPGRRHTATIKSPSASRCEPGRHHTTTIRSPSASHREPGRHHTTTIRSLSASRREPGRHHTTAETGPQASPRDEWEATTVDHHPNQDPVDAPVNIYGTPVGPARNNDD